MTDWDVSTTERFDRYSKKEKISQDVINKTINNFKDFIIQPLSHTHSLCSEYRPYEIWRAKVSDPASGFSKRSGFRIMFSFNRHYEKIRLELIIRRPHLSYGGSAGKYQKLWDETLKMLKDENNHIKD
jgi:hypothetical protein